MTSEELHNEMIAAMKAKDKTRLSIIRQVIGEVKNVEVNERRDATEEDVTKMIKRLIKQTAETLEMSRKAGNNQERTDTLQQQVDILESLLPAQLSGAALVALIEQTIAETGATTRKDMGRVMGALKTPGLQLWWVAAPPTQLGIGLKLVPGLNFAITTARPGAPAHAPAPFVGMVCDVRYTSIPSSNPSSEST